MGDVLEKYSCEAICMLTDGEKVVRKIDAHHGLVYFECGLGKNDCSVLNAYHIANIK